MDRQYQQIAEPLAEGPFLPAWQPQVVDQTPRRGRLTTAVLATAIATFVVAPSALEAAARVTYPDRVERPAIHASRQLAWTGLVAPLEFGTPITWAPTYPDKVWPRASLRPDLQQAFAFHPEPIIAAPAAPEITPPVYPEGVRRATLPIDAHLAWAGLVAPLEFATPRTWTPTYPDRVLRSTLPVAQHQPWAGLVAPLAFATPLTWSPGYPDRLPPARWVAASQQQAFAINVDPIPTPAAVPELTPPVYPHWLPRQDPRRTWLTSAFSTFVLPQAAQGGPADDGIIRRARLVQYAAYVGPVTVPAAVVTQIAWLPGYPDRPWRATLLRAAHLPYASAIEPPAAAPAAPDLSWQGEYPDAVARPTFAARQQRAFSLGPLVPIPDVAVDAPALSWQEAYPALVPRLPIRVAVRAYLFAFVKSDPFIVAEPLPDPRWLARYPDTTRRARLPVADHLVWAGPVSPVAAAVVAELSWQARFPDRLTPTPFRTALQQALGINVDPIAANAFVDLSWQPNYPDRVLAQGWVTMLATAVLPPEAPALTAFLAWQGTYPDRLTLRADLLVGGAAPLHLPTAVIADAVSCIHLSAITITQPTVRALGVTQPEVLFPAVIDLTPPDVRVC